MSDPTARQSAAAPEDAEFALDSQTPELVPAEQVTAALGAAAEFKDKLLRTLAEMENLRKRTEREIADTRQYAITGFARDVLAVADNMHRALEAIGSELRQTADAEDQIAGRRRRADRARTAQDSGAQRRAQVLAAGREIRSQSAPGHVRGARQRGCSRHVAQVIQAGYMLADRVLRPAMVAVAKAAPKSPASSANDNPAPGAA